MVYAEEVKSTGADLQPSFQDKVHLNDLAETSDLVFAMAVKMAPELGLALGDGIALVGARIAGAAALFGGPGFGVLPLAILAHAADQLVRASRNDGSVVVRVRVRGAGDGREEGVWRVTVPARSLAHRGCTDAPGADGSDACVSVLFVACGVGYVEEVGVVTSEGQGDAVLADDRVGESEDVADIVACPFADRVRFQDSSGVFDWVGLVADAYLSVILAQLHAAFGGTVAVRHYIAIAIRFVQRHFLASPVDDSIRGGALGEAIGFIVGEQRSRSRQ